MTESYSAGFIRPEVYAPAVMASINGNLVFKTFATVFSELQGNPGDTLNLVEFARLTDLSGDIAEPAELTPEELTSTAPNSLTIQEASKAVSITWKSRQTAFGDPVDVGRNEQARIIAKRVDTVLRDAAIAVATLEDATADVISYNATIDALAPYGDAVGAEGVSLVIHSKQWRDLVKDANFVRARTGEANSAPGYVGSLAESIPVYMSDLVPVIADGGGVGIDHYRAMLFQGRPCALAHKNEVEVNQQDDILKRTTIVSSTYYFAGGVMRPERIVELRTL